MCACLLPPINPVTVLTPYLVRILGQNPGPKTLQGTNSYLVGSPHLPRLLIDTTSRGPGLPIYLKHLASQLQQCTAVGKSPISGIAITHWHPDHTQAISDVIDLANHIMNTQEPQHDKSLELIGQPRSPSLTPVFKHSGGPSLFTLGYYNGTLTELHENSLLQVAHEQASDTPELQLRTLYTPGHAGDHVCFLLEDAQQQKPLVLFTGDSILGHGSTTVHNLHLYMESLNRLKSLCTTWSDGTFRMLPSHGMEITRTQAKVTEYIANRQQRISKCDEFFALHAATCWYSEADILHHVYPDIPQGLEVAALLNLRHSLYWLSSSSNLVARSSFSKLEIDEVQFHAMLDSWEIVCLSESDNPSLDHGENSNLQAPPQLLRYWEWCKRSSPNNDMD